MTLHPQTDQTDLVSFGASDIPLREKQERVDRVFHGVASRYDLMNDLMSGGLHRLWKQVLVTVANPPRGAFQGSYHHLDVAGGTGDVALSILKTAVPHARSTLLDINADMLDVARRRVDASVHKDQVTMVQGNAEALAFPDKSFDLYTIAFGIRNVPRMDKALAEAYRVLKPGGRFLCLEFSHVGVPGLDTIYDFYSDVVIPRLGQMVAGDAEPYRYLVDSIRRFPDQQAFVDKIAQAGFSRASWQDLSGGIAALHSGWRI